MRSLGIIQARGGSKRLPRKNVKPLNGVPLIGYIIKAGLTSKLDRLIVTTEDDEIAALSRQFGADVPFKRPEELAADYATDEDILMHALDFCRDEEGRDYDIIVKMHPTTPFVLPETIDACIDTIQSTDANCCFTARPVGEPPQWMFREDPDGWAYPLLDTNLDGDGAQSQLLEKTYFPSGAAWAIRVSAFRERPQVYSKPLRMAMMNPLRSIDIDDETDFLLAETIGERLTDAPA